MGMSGPSVAAGPKRLEPPKGFYLLHGHWSGRSWQLLLFKRALWVNLFLMLALLVLSTLALGAGQVKLTPWEVWQALWGMGTPIQELVVRELRLQRILAGIFTGAAFALSGCLMQTLANNRLATPGIIGIDNAATAFAVASVVGLTASIAPPGMALLGAAVATFLAFLLAGQTGTQGYRFIVAGIGIGAIAGALTQLLLSQVAIDTANAAFPWTVGSLNARSPGAVWGLGLVILPSLMVALGLVRGLQLLRISTTVTVSLGVSLKRLRLVTLALSVMLTGFAVAVAGPVGMVALLGPELARLLNRHHGVPLLGAALSGALMMVAADWVGRWMLAPIEIPVGIITAVIGSPYLLWLLLRPASSGP